MKYKIQLYIELLTLFILPPILYLTLINNTPLIPFLIILGIISFLILYFDKTFSFKNTFKFSKIKNIKLRFQIFVISIISSAIFLYIVKPEFFLLMIKQMPIFALILPPAYTLFSVLPQTLLFRTLFFHRYSNLFPKKYQLLNIFSKKISPLS